MGVSAVVGTRRFIFVGGNKRAAKESYREEAIREEEGMFLEMMTGRE